MFRVRAAGVVGAVGASVAVVCGITAPGAGAQETSTTVRCQRPSMGGAEVKISTTGLTPQRGYETFLLTPDGLHIDGVVFNANENGVLETPYFGPRPLPFEPSWVVYHDINGDHRWSPEEDETFYGQREVGGLLRAGEAHVEVGRTPGAVGAASKGPRLGQDWHRQGRRGLSHQGSTRVRG
jgi:hypothetical protein